MEKVKILIVDDHRVVIEGIKSSLQEHPEFEVVGICENLKARYSHYGCFHAESKRHRGDQANKSVQP